MQSELDRGFSYIMHAAAYGRSMHMPGIIRHDMGRELKLARNGSCCETSDTTAFELQPAHIEGR